MVSFGIFPTMAHLWRNISDCWPENKQFKNWKSHFSFPVWIFLSQIYNHCSLQIFSCWSMDAKYIALMPALWENYSDNGTASLLNCCAFIDYFWFIEGKIVGHRFRLVSDLGQPLAGRQKISNSQIKKTHKKLQPRKKCLRTFLVEIADINHQSVLLTGRWDIEKDLVLMKWSRQNYTKHSMLDGNIVP